MSIGIEVGAWVRCIAYNSECGVVVRILDNHSPSQCTVQVFFVGTEMKWCQVDLLEPMGKRLEKP